MRVHAICGCEHRLFGFYSGVSYGCVRRESVGETEECEAHEVGVERVDAELHQCMVHVAVRSVVVFVYKTGLRRGVELSLQCLCSEVCYYIR